MIAVVDYCKGNLKSVERGLAAAGGDALITDDPAIIARADAIVLPGVGAFTDAADTMAKTGQREAIRAAIDAGKPFLGICLGEHLLFEQGVEGASDAKDLPQGLGVLPGTVVRMPSENAMNEPFKVPHVGWNSIEFSADTACPLLEGIDPGEYFYFTHSFIAPETPFTVATTTHSTTFPCVVQKSTAFGVQFHPEKSSDAGAKLLKNFLRIVEGR